MAVSGCATTHLDIKSAEEYCAKNGGVAKIKTKYNTTINVTCNDTARFKITKEKIK